MLGTRGPSRPVSPQRREPGGGHGDNLHPSGTSLHSWTASAASRPSLQLGAPGGHYPELPPRTCVGSAAGGGVPRSVRSPAEEALEVWGPLQGVPSSARQAPHRQSGHRPGRAESTVWVLSRPVSLGDAVSSTGLVC